MAFRRFDGDSDVAAHQAFVAAGSALAGKLSGPSSSPRKKARLKVT